ncbi:MAG: hypothetical protein M3Y57_22135 [Acidobacteriota bacterium]|nr:hypothetical protein [Acidobacteriota bacterium]
MSARNGATAADLLKKSEADLDARRKRGVAFDGELLADLEREGGPEYAQIGALAYGQVLAGIGIATDDSGQR